MNRGSIAAEEAIFSSIHHILRTDLLYVSIFHLRSHHFINPSKCLVRHLSFWGHFVRAFCLETFCPATEGAGSPST